MFKFDISTFQAYSELCDQLMDCSFLDNASKSDMLYKMLRGAELGIGPIASLEGIYTNTFGGKSKPAFTANLMATLIQASKRFNYRIMKHDPAECVIGVYENGEQINISTFTIKDANQAGLLVGPNKMTWQKYPKNMLFSRCISNVAKQDCAAVFGGAPVYTPEELDMVVDEEGKPTGHLPAPATYGADTHPVATVADPKPSSRTTRSRAGAKATPNTASSAESQTTPVESTTNAVAAPDAAKDSTSDAPPGAQEKKDLVAYAEKNGWSKEELGAFMLEQFGLDKAHPEAFTWDNLAAAQAYIHQNPKGEAFAEVK